MVSELPIGLAHFLEGSKWSGAAVEPLPGDASFRRYYRLRLDHETAMLMHAPPPHENPGPFLTVGRWLLDRGFRAPQIIADDAAAGLILLEDFGDDRLGEYLGDADAAAEEEAYEEAIDTLVALQREPPGPFPAYDENTYLREADLFVDWYCPMMNLQVDASGWKSAWTTVLKPVLAQQRPGVVVLRDYHAENIMLLHGGGQGIIDFQDALVGHRAYDLVSLLQDARRDVPEELEAKMLARFVEAAQPAGDFVADYAILGAQRNAKIVGIFTRLARRDGKSRYLAMIPRVWRAMERDLTHPALAPVAAWFDANVPRTFRDNDGGELQ